MNASAHRPGTGPVPADSRVTVVPAADAHAPAVARALLDAHGGLLTRDMKADAELLISEVVGNAVRHGEPDVTVSLRLTRAGADVEVHDCGLRLPVPATGRPNPTQTSGRGMLILAAVADRWGVNVSDPLPGKTVGFSLG